MAPYITIFTATYNRRGLIERLYESLKNQTVQKFEWLIVDDGSADGTVEYINEIVKEAPFNIIYKYLDNGGKHRAINVGSKIANGKWFFIVDSDDYLSENTIEHYLPILNHYDDRHEYASISFLVHDHKGNLVGDKFDDNVIYGKYIDLFELGIKGDRADVIRLSVLHDIEFPEFEGENFLAESSFWLQVSKKYFSVFRNVQGYICDYQYGGLSDRSLANRIRCPNGAMYIYNLQYKSFKKQKLKFRSAVNFWRFYYHGGKVDKSHKVPEYYKNLGYMIHLMDRYRNRKNLPRI